ncbi:MAG: helix-turn-helix transcriptional regulator [Acidobacteria bacterium]|nr:helix-turn-helix transcriptional regulator [Acidobacteriota bacterium]
MIINFAAFLARRREKLGKTQAQVAESCAVTPEAICQFESGRRQPRLALLPRLAQALGVDRRLLARFALQSRAPEFYATLGLEPVEPAELEALPGAC